MHTSLVRETARQDVLEALSPSIDRDDVSPIADKISTASFLSRHGRHAGRAGLECRACMHGLNMAENHSDMALAIDEVQRFFQGARLDVWGLIE